MISAQDNIIWDESSTTILLPEESLENLPIIDDNPVIDWEMVGIIAIILVILWIGYKIKGRKKGGKVKSDKINKRKNSKKKRK